MAFLFAAYRNGSKTVRYLIVGLRPLLVVALARVLSFLLPGIPTIDANELLLVATLIEVTATALGVASRFLVLKLERDRFHAEKDTLESVAERDPLTGLFNRRALDAKFDGLRAQGFDTMALIDLDRFKDMNDRYGHQVGDAVLRSGADALKMAGNRDCIALRLGGEEFMLLLRGPHAVMRGEELRRAMTRRIAHEVDGPQPDALRAAQTVRTTACKRAGGLGPPPRLSFRETAPAPHP
ncbi:GGDEF domain-containing protein [Erythrobacter sp.]|jgi:diguanylate cyclase (GGDEF)-like protein|uniref:GGDEF domain-containing protein n=1 Tax=Erythrobacter sp. TaxID=1042 RepID=UPI002ECC179F|nr:GGDEF domain-containing protein [Erythrobacter sp.]